VFIKIHVKNILLESFICAANSAHLLVITSVIIQCNVCILPVIKKYNFTGISGIGSRSSAKEVTILALLSKSSCKARNSGCICPTFLSEISSFLLIRSFKAISHQIFSPLLYIDSFQSYCTVHCIKNLEEIHV